MLKIRLFKNYKKNNFNYNIVVTDSKTPRNGKFISKLGFYNPFEGKLKINFKKLLYWKNLGAKLNNSVKKLYNLYKIKCFY